MDHVRFRVDDGVGIVELNRPERLNAFTLQMQHELIAVFDRIDTDEEVRAVVVTGAGRGFCAGVDLGRAGETFQPDEKGRGGPVVARIHRCIKPVVAAVNGAAVGVGASLLLPMDVRIASHDARVGFVFTRRGLIPDGVSTWFLPRIVGIDIAAEWFYSGRIIDAGELLTHGLVREVVAPDELLARACAVAHELTDHSSGAAIAITKRLMWRMLRETDPEAAYALERRASEWLGRQPDAAEGIAAFLEKRPPTFPMAVRPDLEPLDELER